MVKRLPSLDGLRALSIFFVLWGHLFFQTSLDLELGSIGVQVFFVISGFLITWLLLQEKSGFGTINLRYFYFRRALRILPLVILFLLTLSILNKAFDLGIKPGTFMASLFFVRNFPFPDRGEWHTGHFWSLAVEEQFYLAFPFLISRLNLAWYKRIVLALIVLIPTICLCFHANIPALMEDGVIHRLAWLFCKLFGEGTALIMVGSLLAILKFEGSPFVTWLERLKGRYLSLLIFIAAMILRLPAFGLYRPDVSDLVFGFFVGCIILMELKGGSFFSVLMNTRFMVLIGTYSYGIYVWQQLFTHQQPWHGISPLTDSMLVNMIALGVVSFLSYEYVEKGCLRYKDRFNRH